MNDKLDEIYDAHGSSIENVLHEMLHIFHTQQKPTSPNENVMKEFFDFLRQR